MKNKIKKIPKHIRDIYAKSDIEKSSNKKWKPEKRGRKTIFENGKKNILLQMDILEYNRVEKKRKELKISTTQEMLRLIIKTSSIL